MTQATNFNPSCAFIIPIFNEEKSIQPTLQALRSISQLFPTYSIEIICVNDGSSDGTAEVLAQESGITVLTHPVNMGYGAALKTGLNYSNKDWALIIDSDGSYPFDAIPTMLNDLAQPYMMI